VDRDDDVLRPAPIRPWHEHARAVLLSVGIGRVAGVLVGTVMALVAGWWLLQPPPPPIEDSLPLASAAAPVDRAAVSSIGAPISAPATPSGGVSPGASSPPSGDGTDVVVHVAGQVRSPGVYRLSDGDRVIDAVDHAGGALRRADLDAVNLAAPVVDGMQVFIPGRDETPTSGAPGGGGAAAAGGVPAVGPVDLNRADAAALDQLPGVGPATAEAIVRHRDVNGPFASVDDLLDVPGIGPAKLDALRDLVAA
jgi:competence protein ComEA